MYEDITVGRYRPHNVPKYGILDFYGAAVILEGKVICWFSRVQCVVAVITFESRADRSLSQKKW